jgi:hypothetical protein
MKQRWVVHISGGSVERGDLTPDREAVNYLGSPLVALSKCHRGRKCAAMALKADRKRCACRNDVKGFIARSRCRVG